MKGCRWHSLKKLGACGNRKVRRWKFSNCLQISIISTPWRQIWIELNFSPLALPSKECESESCSALSDFLWPHRLYSPWNSPGQNTGLGSLSLLRGICPTQGSNPGLPQGSPKAVILANQLPWYRSLIQVKGFVIFTLKTLPRHLTHVLHHLQQWQNKYRAVGNGTAVYH